MTPDREPPALVGRVADVRLLDEDVGDLPASVGRPEPVPPTRTRGRVVGTGATLTGVTLIGGIALIAVGVIGVIAGRGGALAILAIVLGALLAGTHWGWVHVAEITADALESRRTAAISERRRQWLERIEPYARYEISTGVGPDGSITIERVEYRPVPKGEHAFTFARQTERVAVYSGDGAASAVAEHAEQLRQQAAADTERERQRYAVAADTDEAARLRRLDAEEEAAVRRATARALSEQINSHLRDPPVE